MRRGNRQLRRYFQTSRRSRSVKWGRLDMGSLGDNTTLRHIKRTLAEVEKRDPTNNRAVEDIRVINNIAAGVFKIGVNIQSQANLLHLAEINDPQMKIL